MMKGFHPDDFTWQETYLGKISFLPSEVSCQEDITSSLQVLPEDKTPFFVYMLWPPFSFYRLLEYFNLACLSMQCYGIDVLSPTGGLNLVTEAMVYLTGSTVGLMIISVYLSFVLPSEYGVRKNPLFPIIG